MDASGGAKSCIDKVGGRRSSDSVLDAHLCNTTRHTDTMSNDLRNLREFEEGAWRQLNSKSENEPFPADLHNRITAAWSRLAGRNRAIVAAAADEFLTQQAEYNKAKAWVVTASRYKGSVNDDDAYGQETGRPEFSQCA